MKKILFLLLIFTCFLAQNAFAAIVNLSTEGEFQEYINKTGFKLLNDNQIDKHFVFRYSPSEELRTFSRFDDKSVYIPKGVLTFVESEDELAAVIAFQTAYSLQYYENKFFKYNIKSSPKKYESLADKRAVDMLVRSGYSPIAIISMINKLYGEQKERLFSRHVKTSVRLAEIYEYILQKYPEKLERDAFCRNIYYQNFLLTSRKNREMLQNSMHQEHYRSKKKKYR